MISVLLAMTFILLLAGLVVAYVAFPRRGEDVPGAPWVGDALERAVAALPRLEEERARR